MSKVMFKKGTLATLPKAISEGTFYVTTDERAIYLDIDGTHRVRIGDFQEFETLAALKKNSNPSTTALYYIKDVNCLAKWDGENYVQINLDTGATSVEVTGTGNAVTAAEYNPSTRKLTLTMGEKFVTEAGMASKVGEIGEKTVKQYVDEKTQNIASDEQVSQLGTRMTEAEGKITTLVGTDSGKSARAIAAEETAKIVAGADTSYDTLKEIADWISTHGSDAASMNSAILALQNILDGIGGVGEKATVVAYVTDAISALNIGNYALASELTALAARVLALEGKSHEHANSEELAKIASGDKAKWDAAEQNAKSYADGLASNYDAAGDADQALEDAKAYTDTALTWGSF